MVQGSFMSYNKQVHPQKPAIVYRYRPIVYNYSVLHKQMWDYKYYPLMS